jgi:PIN domain nuclease of toxin-antitoxin system
VLVPDFLAAKHKATKTKLKLAVQAGRLSQTIGSRSLPISMEHALRAGRPPGEPRDPFDRMLIAQAQAEDIPIVSNDRILDEYHVQRIW